MFRQFEKRQRQHSRIGCPVFSNRCTNIHRGPMEKGNDSDAITQECGGRSSLQPPMWDRRHVGPQPTLMRRCRHAGAASCQKRVDDVWLTRERPGHIRPTRGCSRLCIGRAVPRVQLPCSGTLRASGLRPVRPTCGRAWSTQASAPRVREAAQVAEGRGVEAAVAVDAEAET